MTYGQGGYRQPDLRPGMPVQTDTGWSGQVVEVIPAPPGYDGTVRVAWQGYGTTDVTLSSLTVENGVAWIRTQPRPQQPQAPQPAVQHTMPLDTQQDDMATQLAGPVRQPAYQEPTHVNPYSGNEPLVTNEPAPVHTAGGDQNMQHVNPYAGNDPLIAPEPPPVQPAGGRQADPDATILPTTPRQAQAADPGATVLPSGRSSAPAAGGYQQPYNNQSDATVLSRPATPDSAETILSRPAAPIAAGMAAAAAATPESRADRVEPETLHEGALSAAPVQSPTSESTPTMPPAPREVTVPVIEEQVVASAEWRDAGAITVRTVMEEIPQTLTHETERDEVFVERVAVGRVLEEGEEVTQRDEDGVTIIPVIVEEAVVVTRRVLAEELRITKRTIPTVQTVQAITRKQRVEIDTGDLADRVHDATGTDAASTPSQAPRGDDTA